MTENEIIKALECCSKTELIENCECCPYFKKGCLDKLHGDIVELINRQKAEIDELTTDIIPTLRDGLKQAIEDMKTLEAENTNLKAEVKRLKEMVGEE